MALLGRRACFIQWSNTALSTRSVLWASNMPKMGTPLLGELKFWGRRLKKAVNFCTLAASVPPPPPNVKSWLRALIQVAADGLRAILNRQIVNTLHTSDCGVDWWTLCITHIGLWCRLVDAVCFLLQWSSWRQTSLRPLSFRRFYYTFQLRILSLVVRYAHSLIALLLHCLSYLSTDSILWVWNVCL